MPLFLYLFPLPESLQVIIAVPFFFLISFLEPFSFSVFSFVFPFSPYTSQTSSSAKFFENVTVANLLVLLRFGFNVSKEGLFEIFSSNPINGNLGT